MAILGHVFVNPKGVDLFLNRMHHFFTVPLRKIGNYKGRKKKKNTHNPNPRHKPGDLLECPEIISDLCYHVLAPEPCGCWRHPSPAPSTPRRPPCVQSSPEARPSSLVAPWEHSLSVVPAGPLGSAWYSQGCGGDNLWVCSWS